MAASKVKILTYQEMLNHLGKNKPNLNHGEL